MSRQDEIEAMAQAMHKFWRVCDWNKATDDWRADTRKMAAAAWEALAQVRDHYPPPPPPPPPPPSDFEARIRRAWGDKLKMKLCKNCRWGQEGAVLPNDEGGSWSRLCKHGSMPEPVEGTETVPGWYSVSCKSMRSRGPCGPAGIYWEPMP